MGGARQATGGENEAAYSRSGPLAQLVLNSLGHALVEGLAVEDGRLDVVEGALAGILPVASECLSRAREGRGDGRMKERVGEQDQSTSSTSA